MKEQDLLISHKRTEKIAHTLSLISLIGIIEGIIFGCLYLIYENPIYDSLAVVGLTVFIFPFVLLQFFMSAGLYGEGMGWLYLLFYAILFPFIDMWFFAGLNSLFNVLPNYHLVEGMMREEFMTKSWICIGIIYLLVNCSGFLYRSFKKPINNHALLFLNL
ncbi:MAG: hypothetical protein ACP5NZ_01720 [Nanobdellota archaeon]